MRILAAAFLLALAAARAGAAAPPVALDPPPGWTDVTAKTPVRGVLIALKGPEKSSFIVARMDPADSETAASLRAFLFRVVDEMRAASRVDYRATGRVETKTFRNGLTARFVRATAAGKPDILIAAVDAGGPPALATMVSAAPDAMMSSLFGALSLGGPPAGAVRDTGTAVSEDGQLQLALGGGLRSRDLTPEEKAKGMVLAVMGAGSEIVFLKVDSEEAAPKDQAAIARATTADAARAPLEKVSAARRAPTAAGPSAVFAWAKMPDSPDLRFASGFLPWSYWGYTLFARGPQADELLTGVLAAIKLGPRAVAGLVEATPKIEIPDEGRGRLPYRGLAASAVAVILLGLALSLRRKNANLPS